LDRQVSYFIKIIKMRIILFFLLLSFAVIESHCQDKIVCSSGDRVQICFQWSEPVCGYITDCTGDISLCSRTFDNECIACNDPTIESFTNGTCTSTATETSEENLVDENLEVAETGMCVSLVHFVEVNGKYVSATDCCGLRGSFCSRASSPVCAYFISCPSEDGCFETRSNSCEACNDVNINYYVSGPCPKDEDLLNEEQLIFEEEGFLSPSEFANWCWRSYFTIIKYIFIGFLCPEKVK